MASPVLILLLEPSKIVGMFDKRNVLISAMEFFSFRRIGSELCEEV